jgi:hypothetical protein
MWRDACSLLLDLHASICCSKGIIWLYLLYCEAITQSKAACNGLIDRRPGSNAMCASTAGSTQAAVLIATSPLRYNSIKQSSPISPISAAADAGSCTSAQAAFAAVAAAEAAVATALQGDARTLQLSEADLFYCSPAIPASLGLQETCRTGFDGSAQPFLQALVDRQQQLKLRQCMPYAAVLTAEQARAMCSAATGATADTKAASSSSSSSTADERQEAQGSGVKCSSSSAVLAQGGLSFKAITEIWQAQVRQIAVMHMLYLAFM